jgi:hypothetical protein
MSFGILLAAAAAAVAVFWAYASAASRRRLSAVQTALVRTVLPAVLAGTDSEAGSFCRSGAKAALYLLGRQKALRLKIDIAARSQGEAAAAAMLLAEGLAAALRVQKEKIKADPGLARAAGAAQKAMLSAAGDRCWLSGDDLDEAREAMKDALS